MTAVIDVDAAPETPARDLALEVNKYVPDVRAMSGLTDA
jgi:hypothetical protein